MARPDVKAKQKQSLTTFMRLAEKQPGAMARALSECAPCSLDRAISQLVEDLQLTTQDADDVIQMLVAFSPLQRSEQDLDTLVAFFLQLAQRLEVVPLSADRVREELFSLVRADAPVGKIAKAAALIARVDRLFLEADITSEIRPIFGEDRTLPPTDAIIFHSLRIQYRQGSEIKDFFVELESPDLERLQTSLSQAVAKDGALNKFSNDHSLRVYKD